MSSEALTQKIASVFQSVGATTLSFFEITGRLFLFMMNSVNHMLRPPYYPRLILRQMIDIGFYSLPVVGLTTLFAGMVMALQSYSGFARFGAESAIPNVVVLSITRELGPVLAGLMIAGRIGAAMAAELGTMRVTEQIDALQTLSTNPFKYLIAPRLIAGITMLPLLVLVGDIIGVLGGYLVSVHTLGFNAATYIQNTWNFLSFMDVFSGLVKAAAFGFIVALMGCYHGYQSKGGAQGVGAATTNAVVTASILILVSDYLLTVAFFSQ
ncbi:MlaE family ABC transporter permease [Curvivirga aplysinae]|uniref:MlaE family ABC transporter permease n=1 Tax=Curvivirga aplysinae TaxID=2529852 RepID=UPI0012BBA749|nr:ABC transporter permease [Curvivirga aplysinae]MTI10031.1 ABC transporter permease [Curvivirga aplysinae]